MTDDAYKGYYFKMTIDPIISGITKDGKNVYASSVEYD